MRAANFSFFFAAIALFLSASAFGDGLNSPAANFASPPAYGNVTQGPSVSAGTVTMGSGNNGMYIQPFTGGGYAAIYSTSSTPNASNYVFAFNSVGLTINGASVTAFAIGGNAVASFSSSGLTISSGGLSIPAGTATRAPLTLTAGALLTTTAPGSFEYNGTALYFTPNGGTRVQLVPAPSVPPASLQAGVVTSGASGAVSVTFSTPFSAAPAVSLQATTGTTTNYTCDLTSTSATGYTATCGTQSVATLGGISTVTGVSGVPVNWIAAGKTQ